jgi:hypothetical protein
VGLIDSDYKQLSLSFHMTGLKEIRSAGQIYQPDDEVPITNSKHAELSIVYCTQETNSLIVTSSLLTQDGETVRSMESFKFRSQGEMIVRLVKQNMKFQQFQILNPFQAKFIMVCEGKQHKLTPYGNYALLRATSAAPLKLVFCEEGWEMQIDVDVTGFLSEEQVVSLVFDVDEWAAGSPHTVTIEPPAFPVAGEEGEWIVVPIDPQGREHIFIPKCPGILRMPKFRIGNQICRVVPDLARVTGVDFPPFVAV